MDEEKMEELLQNNRGNRDRFNFVDEKLDEMKDKVKKMNQCAKYGIKDAIDHECYKIMKKMSRLMPIKRNNFMHTPIQKISTPNSNKIIMGRKMALPKCYSCNKFGHNEKHCIIF